MTPTLATHDVDRENCGKSASCEELLFWNWRFHYIKVEKDWLFLKQAWVLFSRICSGATLPIHLTNSRLESIMCIILLSCLNLSTNNWSPSNTFIQAATVVLAPAFQKSLHLQRRVLRRFLAKYLIWNQSSTGTSTWIHQSHQISKNTNI